MFFARNITNLIGYIHPRPLYSMHIDREIFSVHLPRKDLAFYSTYGFPHDAFHNFKSQNNFLHQPFKLRLTLKKQRRRFFGLDYICSASHIPLISFIKADFNPRHGQALHGSKKSNVQLLLVRLCKAKTPICPAGPKGRGLLCPSRSCYQKGNLDLTHNDSGLI